MRSYRPAVALAAGLCLVLAATARAQAPKKPITVRETLLTPFFAGHQLAPDGSRVLYTKAVRDEKKDWEEVGHVWLYDVATRRSLQLTNSPKGERAARWLADGRVVFTSNRDGKDALWVISPAGGEAAKLAEADSVPVGTVSPDGTRLLYTEATERPDRKEWDTRVKKKDDGYVAEQKLTYTHVWVYDLATAKKTRLTSGDFDHTNPAWSPDGKWVAYVSNRSNTTGRDPNFSNNSDIWLVPADSGAARQLTSEPGPDGSPVFSPDGKSVAYASSDRQNSNADQMDVKVIGVDGGTPRNLTSTLDYSISSIEWSMDGRHIYFMAAEGLGAKLYRVPASGGAPTSLTLPDGFVPGGFDQSRDGRRWLITGADLDEPAIVLLADAEGRNARRIMEENAPFAEHIVARAEPLTWKGADGWDIEGVLTYPTGYTPGQRVPLILNVHGGPFGRFGATFNATAQVWAARGYAVLQPNPRGSSGRTYEFGAANIGDWGGKDFADIMSGIDHVVALGVADPERMAIMGGSYGGFMTFWAITQTDRFKAAIGHAAISDWYSFFGQTDIPNLLEFGFVGQPWTSKEMYERWSPIEFATRVTTPLLITHGEEDRRVPIAQGEQYFRTLKKLGRTVEFLRFPREGHGIAEPMHRLYLDAQQEAWLAKYIKGRPVS